MSEHQHSHHGASTGYKMVSKDVTTNVPDFRPGASLDSSGKPKKIKVKSKTPASVPEFTPDTTGLQAAVDYYKDQGGVGYVVNLFNTQNMTNEMNRIRSDMSPSGTVSESKLREQALTKFTNQIAAGDEQLLTKLRSMAGDQNRVQAEIIQPIMEEIRKGVTTTGSDLYEIVEGEE